MKKNIKDFSLFDLVDENGNSKEKGEYTEDEEKKKVLKITIKINQGHFGIVDEFYSENITLSPSGMVYEKIPSFDYKDPDNSELYDRNPYKIIVSSSRYLCNICFKEFIKVYEEGFPEETHRCDMNFYTIVYHLENGENVRFESSGSMSRSNFCTAHSCLKKILPVEVNLLC